MLLLQVVIGVALPLEKAALWDVLNQAGSAHPRQQYIEAQTAVIAAWLGGEALHTWPPSGGCCRDGACGGCWCHGLSTAALHAGPRWARNEFHTCIPHAPALPSACRLCTQRRLPARRAVPGMAAL